MTNGSARKSQLTKKLALNWINAIHPGLDEYDFPACSSA